MVVMILQFVSDNPEEIKKAAEICVAMFNRMKNSDMLVLSQELRDKNRQEIVEEIKASRSQSPS